MWVLSLGRWKRRWPPKDDEMIQHEERKHQGTTTLTFTTSLGTPLEGLRYRLSDGQGAVREGATGKGGRGPLIKKVCEMKVCAWRTPGIFPAMQMFKWRYSVMMVHGRLSAASSTTLVWRSI